MLCGLPSKFLATCMYFTTTPRGIVTAYSTQFVNQCALPRESTLSGICICPTIVPVISGGDWRIQAKRDGETCDEVVEPNAYGWNEDGLTWMVHKDDTAWSESLGPYYVLIKRKIHVSQGSIQTINEYELDCYTVEMIIFIF
ncbi:hypothetical protein GGI43DRAFT_394825 [Trichoderma evansii]